MLPIKITQKYFLDLIKKSARKETSFDPENWNEDNPLRGHCAVVSLLAQDYFGGELIRGSLKDHPKYSYL